MKKMLALLCAVVMMSAAMIPALAENTDATSSASVNDFYASTALTGDELMNAINSFSGFYIVTTTNPDGSANSAFFIYGCVENAGKYYLKMGLAENQSKLNLQANGEGMAVYAANPSGEEGAKPYAVAGARMRFTVVNDAEVLAALGVEAGGATILCEITEVKPLG